MNFASLHLKNDSPQLCGAERPGGLHLEAEAIFKKRQFTIQHLLSLHHVVPRNCNNISFTLLKGGCRIAYQSIALVINAAAVSEFLDRPALPSQPGLRFLTNLGFSCGEAHEGQSGSVLPCAGPPRVSSPSRVCRGQPCSLGRRLARASKGFWFSFSQTAAADSASLFVTQSVRVAKSASSTSAGTFSSFSSCGKVCKTMPSPP